MPGKVNPTQCEAALMVCIEVMSSDVGVQMAAAEGNFELNTFRPMVIRSLLTDTALLPRPRCSRSMSRSSKRRPKSMYGRVRCG